MQCSSRPTISGTSRLRWTGHDCTRRGGNARIVSVSSTGNQKSHVIFDDSNTPSREYKPFGAAYGPSKTANVLLAVVKATRRGGRRITANALDAGRDRDQAAAPNVTERRPRR